MTEIWQKTGRQWRLALCTMMIAAALAAGPSCTPSFASAPASLEDVLTAIAPPPSAEALVLIPDRGRKLLALRSYVRSGAALAQRWSWTDAEIKAFAGSPGEQALLAEVNAVKAHFNDANPGHELYVHGTTRSLDEQIAKWNSNESVGAAAAEMEAAFTAAFGEAGAVPDPKKLAQWLRGYQPSKRPNLAAPGMTLHGRASAIDFQVMKDGRIYAGANGKQVESIWRAEGWDQKLKASITAAGPSFVGPLANPDEPWHYDYHPKADASLATAD
ncbi:hypothetical protein [Aestuariivirga sp.]|jgi:hypothetical protein|uniref:hypothetical protein n=1 Tax=Aestuariivirga sp. TaxID=2650926 RepID=UPI003782FEAB